MANIPKLRLMLARLEKEASSRWRTLQGLTALLGKDTVATTPRIGALQLAAKQQGVALPGEGFAKAMSSLPESPIGLKFNDLSMREPSQLFRGASQPADLVRGGYSTDYLHAAPFKNVAEAFGKIKHKTQLLGPPNAASNTEGGFVYKPQTLVGVYNTAKNQKYVKDYGLERNATQLTSTDRIDPTAGLNYAYRALQDSNKLKKLNKNQWPVGLTGLSPTPSDKQLAQLAHFSNRYETAVKPSQLQSILLDNRVLPATAKGRELLQTGTLPAGAQLPPEILKGRELLQPAGKYYASESAQLPATSGQGMRTFPEIQQFLRKRYAAPVTPDKTSPTLWSRMLNYFQNLSMPAGAKLPAEILKSASWMDMVQRAIAKLPTRILPTRMQSASRIISTPQATVHVPQALQDPPKPQVLYRGYLGYEPEGTEGILHASLHPDIAAMFTSDRYQLKNKINLISRFEVNPQTQKHYLDYGLLGDLKQGKKSPLGNPLYHGVPKWMKEQDPVHIAWRNTGRTVPEIQQFLKQNPNGSYRGGVHHSFNDFTYETGIPSSYPYMRNSPFAGMSGYNPATKELSDIPHNIAKDLIKGAGWMDMVQRAIAKLPGRTPQVSQLGKQLYRGFPLGAEETGFKGIEHASLHPSVAAGHAEDSGGLLRFVLKKFDADPQVQQHFPHRGLLSSLGFPGRTAEAKANPIGYNFRTTGRTIPEIQQFLKDNPIYHIPKAQASPANYPIWAEASREHGAKGLGHLGYDEGYEWSTVPAKGWNLFGGQGSTKKLFKDLTHETGVHTDNFSGLVSFNPNTNKLADIPHNIAKDLVKGAGVFTASGNKVQGVGLRKLYHSLLDERGLTGLGVNNEDTGDVELSFDGDEARRKEVFKELAARIKAKTNHPVTFAPTTVPQSSTPVKLSNKDSERLNAIHHLAYRMSNMYDPTHPLMDPNDTFKQKLADRFRLQVNKSGLTGTVPSRAAEQLLGTRPMYAGMMPARRTRSEAEALSDMPMEQQQRLLKALKSGRGFLAPVVDKLASAAVEAPMNLYSYIPNGSIEHVKKHGLLSGNELAKPENRHLLDIARPDGDADRWLKERDARLAKSPWTNSYNGPSAFFGDIDAGKIHDKHPIKKFNTTRAVIKLRELLRDYPATKMEGSELIPFSDTTYDALDEKGQNEFVNKRHHTLSLDEIKALLTRGQNPKDMWKDFKDTEGKYYASDVPHAQVVTPMGKIPSKYIEFK